MNEWDDYAEGWDDDPSARFYANQAFDCLTAKVDLESRAVFDFGCGTGLLTEKIALIATSVVALDSSAKMTEVLKRKSISNVSVITDFLTQDTLHEHGVLQNKFDIITASSVCAFVPDYAECLALLKSMLRQDGVFFQWDWLSIDEKSDFGFSEKEVKSKMDQVGFKDIKISNEFIIESPKGKMPVLMAIARNR